MSSARAQVVWVTILAQDPSVTLDGKILRARVPIPAEPLEPGPTGPRFQVVDYDATRNVLSGRYDAETGGPRGEDRFMAMPDADLIADSSFRAQNAYAIAARTLAVFESALGRRIPWNFNGHQLYLVPAAFDEGNAYYDRDSEAILFGYVGRSGRVPLYLSLSHDVVAHETTHAILDGIRSRFEEPSLPDQLAFHEALADLVALLLAFSMPEVVKAALGRFGSGDRIAKEAVSEPNLRDSVLFGLAEEFGEELGLASGVLGRALRRSVSIEPDEVRGWRDRREYAEPHRRGEILVAAVARSFRDIWRRRLEALVSSDGTLDRDRATEEGSKSAQHVLTMLVRAIDYCPPLEFEYEDFLAALLTADEEVAPNDETHDYRGSLERSFADFDIKRGSWLVGSDIIGELDYSALNALEFRGRTDEGFRFLWQNASRLGIGRSYYTFVDSVLPSTRIGPDGLLVQESLLIYRQMLNGTAAELAALPGSRFAPPEGLDPKLPIQLHGGGVIILDQFGRAKYHHFKPLFDWDRQNRRLEYLYRQRLFDSSGRLGFSFGIPESERFAELHESPLRLAEAW